jgi:hypothetical protein
VGVQVEEAGQEGFAAGVEAGGVGGGKVQADGDDASVRDEDVGLTRGGAGAVDEGGVLNQEALRRSESGAEQKEA